jgi:hypothetical protein
MKKRGIIILIILVLMIGSAFSERISNPDKILELYTKEEIQQKFKEVRFSEWVDEFEVKRDGIYFLTEKWQYMTYLNEDESLYFSGIKSRYDYNREQIALFFIWVIVISVIIVAIVLLSSVKWHGFTWYKKLHGKQ